MIKVMHIITGLNDGGAEGVLYRLCLHDSGHLNVVVSLMNEGKYGPLLQSANIEVHCLDMPQGKFSLRGMLHLLKLMRNQKPDVVQTWMYHADIVGGIVARLAGIRNIAWGIRHSNLTPETVKRSTIRIAQLCAALSSWIPKRIVCCSQKAVQTHIEIGYSPERFIIIPNGYDLDRLVPNKLSGENFRKEIQTPSDTPLIGMVGRFSAQKDHKNLLDALNILKKKHIKFNCILVGSNMTHENHEIFQYIRKHQLDDVVKLIGQRNDIPAVMNALDLHVLSSCAGEAFPNVLAEAMACGTPCVTTDVGDASIIVGNTGWVVSPKNCQALADSIQAALNELANKSLWTERKLASRKYIESNFTIQKMIKQFGDTWKEISSN